MRALGQLLRELDGSNKTRDKVAALERYFEASDEHSGAWGLWLLCGNKLPLRVGSRRLREWAGDLSGYPDWLVEECYERVGDLAETAALLFPERGELTGEPPRLAEMIEERLLPLANWDAGFQFQLLREFISELDRDSVFLTCKLLTGGFRMGVSKALVLRALSQHIGIDVAVLTHRLMGDWAPTPELFASLRDAGANAEALRARPYPFYLAAPLPEAGVESLGDPADWQAEWKWDGIRAQMIVRDSHPQLWSRGEERLTEGFPELVAAAGRLPEGTVLDGEVLCWMPAAARPLEFHQLQRRITRKEPDADILREAPAVFMAYDLLEYGGADVRGQPLAERRRQLEALVRDAADPVLRVSPLVAFADWNQLRAQWEQSRAQRVEGLMLKTLDGQYKLGRVRGEWWKWKVDPWTADLVLMYAQAGHGRRSGLYTDYTLGAWQDGKLVPVAKAYSGLSNQEINQLDQWIRANTLARRGPVRTVPPQVVLEIAFEGIQPSTRHKSGIALRFPRIHRWRQDKPHAEADSIDTLRQIMATAAAE